MNNWIEIDEARLAGNLHAIGEVAGPETTVLAVVKANAYGHCVAVCAPMLVRAGVEWLGVTSVTEAAEVRAALAQEVLHGMRQPQILIMSGILPAAVPAIVEHRLTPVVWTVEQVRWLAAAGSAIRLQVEVDTGMSRQGVRPGVEMEALLAEVKQHPQITLDGVFTHFCSSEVTNSELSRRQVELYVSAVDTVRWAGLRVSWLHVANTSAVDNPVDREDAGWLVELAASVGARALVRTGLALYGYCLPIEGTAKARLAGRVLPVMTWKTSVLDVRELSEGDTVGYNATYTAPGPRRVALLSVGYADGLRRELSGCGWVMIGEQKAPILGRISMNLTIVDVTEIGGVRVGDEAVVLGEDVTAEDHARLAGTIAYEIVCGVHPCP